MARYVKDMDAAINWFYTIQEFEQSKLVDRTIKANHWCEERGLSMNSFRYWRRKFIDNGVRTVDDVINGVERKPQFVEITGLPIITELQEDKQLPLPIQQQSKSPVLKLSKNDLKIELSGDVDDRFLILIREVIADA